MANIFGQQQQQNVTPRQALEAKYNGSRHNLLLVVIFSLVNLILLLTNSNTYFLFSASMPYIISDFGMFFCGKYPAEYYADMGEMTFLDPSVLVVMVIISVVIIGVYLLCWWMSRKNNVGWLIAALVLFGIDTVVMFLFMLGSSNMLFDILFHAWVIYYLITGILANAKLKKLPEDESTAAEAIPFVESTEPAPAEDENKPE